MRVKVSLDGPGELRSSLLNAFSDGPALLGRKRDGLEDQQVDRALDEIACRSHTRFIYNTVV